MSLSAVRAICFDLDNTLWDIEPVLVRAERILADWLRARYPRIPERFSPAKMMEVRASVLRERPDRAQGFLVVCGARRWRASPRPRVMIAPSRTRPSRIGMRRAT